MQKNALQTAGAELQGVWNDNQQLVYRGYLLVRAFTWARRDSMLDWKSSRAHWQMREPTTFISASLKPREVTAGVPTRMPEVTKGFSGSLGMAFLLTVI